MSSKRERQLLAGWSEKVSGKIMASEVVPKNGQKFNHRNIHLRKGIPNGGDIGKEIRVIYKGEHQF